MGTIQHNDLRKGMAIVYNGEPAIILDLQRNKTAMRKAYMQCRIRGLKTGNVYEYNFKQGEKIEEAEVAYKKLQFTYSDDNFFYFMDENYEQQQLDVNAVGDRKYYLLPGLDLDGVFFEDKLFELKLPVKVELKVTQAPPGVKGDTAAGGGKQVTLETGLVVTAPLFINEGEKVRVNTDTGEYVERVNK